jgi:hypothetical protein
LKQLIEAIRNPFFWVALGSAFAAWASFWNGRRTLRLARLQEERRAYRLVVYLIQGYCRAIPGARVFEFSISVSNPSDINNSVDRLELQISYTTSQGFCMAVKVPHKRTLAGSFPQPAAVLSPPIRIDAHQTVAGLTLFEVSDALIGTGEVDGYTLLLSDAHGAVTKLEQAIVSEISDSHE